MCELGTLKGMVVSHIGALSTELPATGSGCHCAVICGAVVDDSTVLGKQLDQIQFNFSSNSEVL